MSRVIIDNDKCLLCCDCVNVCREEVLGVLSGRMKVIKPTQCCYCEDCSDICESKAIKVVHDYD